MKMLISGPGWAGKSVALLGGIMVRGNLVQIMDEKHTHASIHKRLFIQPEAPPTTTLLRLCIHVRYVGVNEVQSLLHMYLYEVRSLIFCMFGVQSSIWWALGAYAILLGWVAPFPGGGVHRPDWMEASRTPWCGYNIKRLQVDGS